MVDELPDAELNWHDSLSLRRAYEPHHGHQPKQHECAILKHQRLLEHFHSTMATGPHTTTGEKFQRLVDIMARLRAPDGCPWDREQSFDTIKPYLLEETYEVMEAIDARDFPGLAEELGDLMLQAVFFAQMASDEGRFTIDDSLDAISEKLIRRHPHVFGTGSADTADDVKRRWEEIKSEEKARKGATPQGMLDSVP